MSRALPSVVLIALAFALASCTQDERGAPGTDKANIRVADVVCRPTPVGRQTTGCYLSLTAPVDDRLVGVSSPVAGRAQVHESRMESNMIMMYELKGGLPLPAGQTVELKPGGVHIMLLSVTEPLKAGDTVPLILTFASAAPVETTASVGQPALTDTGHGTH